MNVTRATLHTPLFFINDTATTELYTLSLHDALPILLVEQARAHQPERMHRGLLAERPDRTHQPRVVLVDAGVLRQRVARVRSEEHTSELQSQFHLVCRLLLEKKKKKQQATVPY